MKKAILFVLLISSIVLNSCSKSSSSSSNQGLPNEVTINGVTYSYTANTIGTMGRYGSGVENTCDNKTSFYQWGPVFKNASYELALNFNVYQNDIDFNTTNTGDYSIKNDGISTGKCFNNMDLLINFSDKNVNSNYDNCSMQNNGASNTITSIKLVTTTAASKTYLVSGNFTCNVINPNNKSIPISGNYNIYVKALL